MNAPTHPIAAISTPPGRGALAVIRLTGDGAQKFFTEIIIEKEKFKKEAPRRIGIYTVVDTINTDNEKSNTVFDGIRTDIDVDRKSRSDINNAGDTIYNPIDEVTAVKYNAPHSYTGEDMVEIFCHGGTIIPEKIIEQLFYHGAQAAGRGEFSRRALINGKIGVLKAESIRELIDSQTETHLRSAQLAYFGKQSESIERLKQEIIAILSDIESRIEFDEDDDVAESKRQQISANKKALASIVGKLQDELRCNDRIRALDDGIIVTIAGPANAGKSSLFNELLGYDRSIVHDRPGTTRDIVSERLNIDGMAVKLFDSAGIRETGDEVERLGMDRTRSAVAEAHAVLWVTSATEALEDGEQKEILAAAETDGESEDCTVHGDLHRAQNIDIYNGYEDGQRNGFHVKDRLMVIINKIDLDDPVTVDNNGGGGTYIAMNNRDTTTSFSSDKSHLIKKRQFCEEHGLKYVETSIIQKINREQLFDAICTTINGAKKDIPTPAIIINERHRDIVKAVAKDLQDSFDNFNREEIAAHCLRTALDRLAELLGHVGSDEVINKIFERFCIGK